MHVEKFFDRNLGDLGTTRIAGSVGKGVSRNTNMNGTEKSDSAVVPVKLANEGDKTLEESVEERALTKGNTPQPITSRTQSRVMVSAGLEGVRKAAGMHKDKKFTALLHHVTLDRLRDCYFALKRQAASGVDGVTWAQYGEELEDKLIMLHDRLHSGGYRAKPARGITIPKMDGSKRHLSIWSLEDKIVQQALSQVLNAIYEQDFLGFSYGFRPGRGQHDALDALSVGIKRCKVNWVLDADIQSFFDNIDHDQLIRFLEHRVSDKRVLRLVRMWISVGTQTDAGRCAAFKGVPQGSVISPLLSNIYLHYVLDLWVWQWRSRYSTGDVIAVRYADDTAFGFQHVSDAHRFKSELDKRLAQFGLNLHPKKTRLIQFGRFAQRDRKQKGQNKPETFDFLGFTFFCSVTRLDRRFIVGRKTIKKRLLASVKEIKRQLRRRLHEPIGKTGEWLRRILVGHLNYFAVPGNLRSIQSFFMKLRRLWLRSLRRRSQRNNMTWPRYARIWNRLAPRICVTHDYPDKRFDART